LSTPAASGLARRERSGSATRRVLELFEPRRGGVPAHVALLGAGLLERGWDVTVAGPPDAPAMAELAAAGAKLVSLELKHRPHPSDVVAVRRLLRVSAAGPMLIHAHATKAGFLAAWLSRLADVPALYTPHAWVFDRALSPPVRAVYAFSERRTVRRHRLVVAVAESELELALRHRITSRDAIRVVHNGLPAIEFAADRASARRRLGLAADGVVASWVGRRAPQKRPQDLPALARALARDRIRLVALGDGLAGSREARAVEDAGGAVLADGADPLLVYAAADVLVATSAWEGHPLAILEAMRARLPVIAYGVGGVPEQVVHGVTGYLVPVGSVDELAAWTALVSHDDALRARLGAAAGARAEKLFGLERMLDETEALYDEVLTGSS